MGIGKKVNDAKESYLLLCQQYNRLGMYREAEIQGWANKDIELFKTSALALNEQYKEMGDQMMVLGRALDNLGGESVLHGPINLTPVTSGRVSADKPNPSAPPKPHDKYEGKAPHDMRGWKPS